MSGYGLIAGKNTQLVQNRVNETSEIKVENRWDYIDDLRRELFKIPVEIIDDLESILVLDTGLKNTNNVDLAVEEFLSLQDIMESKGLKHVKLYYVTRNNNIFTKLKGNINGMEGMHYKNVEMFFIEGNLSIKYMSSLLLGKMDTMGVRSSKNKSLTQVERLELEKQALIENASRVSKESLEFGNKEPVVEINQEDILGSKKFEENKKQEEFKARKLEREIEALKKKNAKKSNNKRIQKLQEEEIRIKEQELAKYTGGTNDFQGKDLELVIDAPISLEEKDVEPTTPKVEQTIPSRTVNNKHDVPTELADLNGKIGEEREELKKNNIDILTARDKGVPKIRELIQLYQQLSQQDSDTIEQKIRSDKGVISFIGQRGSGTSGLLAQSADVYAMLGRKVLIIDLDILLRSQTMYYPTYSDSVKIHKGVSNSLIKMTQTTDIKSNAVPVTSKIDMLSTEKTNEIIQVGFHSTIVNIFDTLIDNARKDYDIILIDLPLEYINFYLRHVDRIDRNIFVLKNTHYDIEDFFSIQLQSLIESNDVFSSDLFNKSSIVLNKYRRDYRDSEGYQINKHKIKEMLLKAGSPYDRIPIIGEIPEYSDWEEQYFNKIRYIWQDDLALELYRRIVSKLL